MEEYIREVTTKKVQFIIIHSTKYKVEIKGHQERHEVDIQKKIVVVGIGKYMSYYVFMLLYL